MPPRVGKLDTDRLEKAIDALRAELDRPTKHTAHRILWAIVGPWRGFLALGIMFMAVHGLALGFQNLTPKWLISDVISARGLTDAQRWTRGLALAGAYIVISIFGRSGLYHLGIRLTTRVRENIIFVLRTCFFRHVNHLCLRYQDERASGETFNYLFGTPLENFIRFFQVGINTLPGSLVSIILTIGVIGVWDPVLTAALFLAALGSFYMMNRARRKIRHLQKDYQHTEAQVSADVADVLRGRRAVKQYTMERAVADDFDGQAHKVASKRFNLQTRTHLERLKFEAIQFTSYAVLLLVALWRYMAGGADAGVIAAYLVSFVAITNSINAVYMGFVQWGSIQASLDRIAKVLLITSSTPEPAPQSVRPLIEPRPTISIRNLSFRYNDRAGDVLRDVNIEIPYGRHVAFVGPSGAGKTTLAEMLMRFYDPTEGSIEIGGVDIRNLHTRTIRRMFGIVPQNPFMFRTTVRRNIVVAAPDADRQQILDACRRAGAMEFIQRLPNGLDEKIGEEGSMLSGGQKQRLAIARVLLSDPPFFIFDEATSALDALSENMIQRTVRRELSGKTVIFIAHRLATVRNCDKIYVMDEGRCVQQGTYHQLLRQEGLFARLVKGQQLM